MTQIAIAEALDSHVVDWMEKVGDEHYKAECRIRQSRPPTKREEKA
jgi:hypothetical protein